MPASLRLRILSRLLALGPKRQFARLSDPAQATRDFERSARLAFRVPPFTHRLRRKTQGGVPLNWVHVGRVPMDRVILYLHGGAFICGSARTHLSLLSHLSRHCGLEVCAPDYRQLPQAGFPAPLEDALAAWDHLRALGYGAHQIMLAGDSAGGGLAFSLLSQVLARGERPAGLFAFSPWTDLTYSGQSITQNAKTDCLIPTGRMGELAKLYLGDTPADDARASPLFAEFCAPPPVLMQVGGGEVLADDTYRMAAKLTRAGGEVTVQTFEAAPHVWQMFYGVVPEAREALCAVATFVQTSLDSAKR
ncbi:Monoterpene epsilon-lactone hydrolase [Aquimixticola soesokkakensis]|uniref:Monoterpene epsilon-lactone hydrolase n=1 Tax=Aquimixticola soesokkakensis TaxID=1519096 RepID=A0A1Y5T3A1_9RHOB|nr:alpha/beta hydrolase [Aquimixticola soesokkakensis]SLN53198.1 Monoterpene epsilon-lactone hydrolase [Aquimixticola soesokkakensis]